MSVQFLVLVQLMGFGPALRTYVLREPFFWGSFRHLQAKRGAAPPFPRPSQFPCSIRSLYNCLTAILMIFTENLRKIPV
jgi:hypothetical protein